MATFFVCGYTSNGMVLTHFMPHALEHNFTEIQASMALGVMGAMNVIGTIGSGWLCDRFGRRGPLAIYYFVRGVSLIFLLYVWDVSSLHFWAALFGLNYISTVPPTTTLTANIFGRYSVGELSGWIFFSHQVGAALGAALAGWVFEWTGGYSPAFVSAALMAFVAAGLALAIREEPVTSRPTATHDHQGRDHRIRARVRPAVLPHRRRSGQEIDLRWPARERLAYGLADDADALRRAREGHREHGLAWHRRAALAQARAPRRHALRAMDSAADHSLPQQTGPWDRARAHRGAEPAR
jgi:MFS family permease